MTRPATLLPISASVLLSGLVLLASPAAASELPSADESGWYGAAALGYAKHPSSSFTTVEEGNPRLPIRLTGETLWRDGALGSLAIGRQMQSRSEGDSEPRHWRLEGEWLHARIKRGAFKVAAVNANLDDALTVNGLFLNGLVRIASTERTRWWAGAGIGWVKGSVPNAVNAKYPCGCLADASGHGTALRIKLQGERLISEKTSVFVELGYTRLPSIATPSGQIPHTRYDGRSFANLSAGLKMRF